MGGSGNLRIVGRDPLDEDLDWVIDDDLHARCVRIVSRFVAFEHIDMNNVLVVRCDFDDYSGAAVAKCHSVMYPYRMLDPDRRYLYIISVYTALFEDFPEKTQNIILFHELLHIPSDFEGRKLRGHTIEDFFSLVDSLGPNWVNVPEDGVIDILADIDLDKTYGPIFNRRQ